MGTRGAIGTRLNGLDRIHYNHYDSYPSGLGLDFVKDVGAILQAEDVYRKKVVDMKLVDEGQEPTDEDRKKYAAFFRQVSTGKDWYSLLRELQGKLKETLDLGIGIAAGDRWMADSLFNEYSYVINFDDRKIEFYKGFNEDRSAAGRYAGTAPKTVAVPKWVGGVQVGTKREKVKYAGVRLIAAVPFDVVREIAQNEDRIIVGWLEFLYDDGEGKVDIDAQAKALIEATGAKQFIVVKV